MEASGSRLPSTLQEHKVTRPGDLIVSLIDDIISTKKYHKKRYLQKHLLSEITTKILIRTRRTLIRIDET